MADNPQVDNPSQRSPYGIDAPTGGLVIDNAKGRVSRPPLERRDAYQGSFIENASGEVAALTTDDIVTISSRLKFLAEAAQTNKTSPPDHVIFGVHALKDYEAYLAWDQGGRKGDPPNLYADELAAAYFAVLAEEKAILIGLNQDIKSTGGRKSTNAYESTGAGVLMERFLESRHFGTWTEAEKIEERNKLRDLRVKMVRIITGEKGDTHNIFADVDDDSLVMGDGKGTNKMHTAISDAALGNKNIDPKSGLLGGTLYESLYPQGKKWETLEREERIQVYRALSSEQKRAVAFASIEQGAGIFLQNIGKEIQMELAGKVVPAETREKIKYCLEEHRGSAVAGAKIAMESEQKKLEALKKQKEDDQKELVRLTANETTAGSIAQLEAYKAYLTARNTAPSGGKSLIETQIESLSAEINSKKAEADLHRETIRLGQGDRNQVAPVTAATQRLQALDAEIQRREKELNSIASEASELVKVTKELKGTRARQKEIENRKNGTGGVSQIDEDIKKAEEQAEKLKKAYEDANKEGGHLPHSDYEGQAMERLYAIDVNSYNKIQQEVYKQRKDALVERSVNGDKISGGIETYRRLLLENIVGHHVVMPDAVLNELMVSELDFIRIMAKTYKIPADILDMSQVDTADNQTKIAALNKLLQDHHANPTDIENARKEVDQAFGKAREVVYREIARHNIWEYSHSIRIGLMEMQEKVIRGGKPFSEKPAKEIVSAPPKTREVNKEYKINPDIGKAIENSNHAIGVDTMLQKVRIENGVSQGNYFLLVGAKPDGAGGITAYHELWDGGGQKKYGEISDKALAGGKITSETALMREDLLLALTANRLNRKLEGKINTLVQSGKTKEEAQNETVEDITLGSDVFSIGREKGTNKLYVKKHTRGGTDVQESRIYLESLRNQRTPLLAHLLGEGNQEIADMEQRAKEYAEQVVSPNGWVDISREVPTGPVRVGPIDKLIWADNESNKNNKNNIIIVDFGKVLRRGMARDTKVQAPDTYTISGNIIDNDSIQDTNELMATLELLKPEVKDKLFGGMYGRFMELSEESRSKFLQGQEGFRSIGVTLPNNEQLQINSVDGKLKIKRTIDENGNNIPVNEQVEENMEEYINMLLVKGGADYQANIKAIGSAVGKEFMRSLHRKVSESPQPIKNLQLKGGINGLVDELTATVKRRSRRNP